MADEDFDDDLLAIAGISRQPAGKKRARRAATDSSDELSAEEGQIEADAGPARRKGAPVGGKKRRVVTPRSAEQVSWLTQAGLPVYTACLQVNGGP